MATTGLSADVITPFSAIFLSIAGVATGFIVVHAAQGWKAIRQLVIPILVIGLLMGVAQLIVASTRLWNIAAFSAGMVGLLISYPLARRYRGEQQENGTLDLKALAVAVTGYAILVGIILIVQLIPSIQNFLSKIVLQVNFPEVSTSEGFITPAGPGRKIAIFGHTGALLVYVAILAYLIYRIAGLYKKGATKRIIEGTIQKVMSSSVSIASMVTMAVIMENSGMTDTLARGLAEGMGRAFPLIAPWIGALGAFMTGSNTNSNVVFGALQMRTAELLGYSVAIILAAQTAGAALASIMAPTKVVVGTSTAGMAGHEGDVMRKLLGYAGLLVLLISLLTGIAILIY
jgi:lactate permease